MYRPASLILRSFLDQRRLAEVGSEEGMLAGRKIFFPIFEIPDKMSSGHFSGMTCCLLSH
jgi:hypothetical protein